MRLLPALCLGLCLIALQVVLGARAFYPEAFEEKTDVIDLLLAKATSIQDTLSPDELRWLVRHPVVIVGVDPDFYPVEMFDERGRYSGLGGDYMRLMGKSTGLDLQPLRLPNWAASEKQAREGNVDMFMAVAKTGRRDDYLLFTTPYINMPGIIMTRRNSGLDKVSLADLKGKKVAVVNNYSWHDFLKEKHPEITAIPVADTLAALQRVVTGEADAVIDYEFNLKEKIQTGGIMQVEPAGKIDTNYGHAVAVRKDWPELFGIISKALAAISPEEQKILARKWLQKHEAPVGQERRLQWIFFFAIESILLCLALIWLWQRELRLAVARRLKTLEDRRNQHA